MTYGNPKTLDLQGFFGSPKFPLGQFEDIGFFTRIMSKRLMALKSNCFWLDLRVVLFF